MSDIRLAWGTATGPTAMAAYDAALADAGVGKFNLVTLSSVIPAGATLEAVGTAPDLGAAGEALYVVEGAETVPPGEAAAAGVGWARDGSGRGIFYEAGGRDESGVRAEIEAGLAAGRALRDWEFVEEDAIVVAADPDPDAHASAVVLATYGEGRPLV